MVGLLQKLCKESLTTTKKTFKLHLCILLSILKNAIAL